MNRDKLKALFAECDAKSDFAQIPAEQRLHPHNFLCGLLKVSTLLLDPAEFPTGAEHDILYLADASELVELTMEDVVYLRRCCIHYSSEGDCLARFA